MPKATRYPNLLLEGKREELDAALAFISDAACLGTEEIAPLRQRAYFPPGSDLCGLHRELAHRFPSLRCKPAEPLAEEDWLRSWKKDLHGLALGERFFVVPSWEPLPSTPREILRIDPERAFGTGTHDTTRLCIGLIEDFGQPHTSVIDAGTGTGILAMAAAKLGCRPVMAIERDPDAAACAHANFCRNDLAEVVRLQVCSISEAEPAPADLVVANLSFSAVRRHWPRLSSWLRPAGRMILSGLLDQQAVVLVQGLSSRSRVLQERSAGEWVALLVKRR